MKSTYDLELQHGRWVLIGPKGLLDIDFINDKKNYHRPLPRGQKELISRAIGGVKDSPQVADCTLGLAQDAVTLARLGYHVIGFERDERIFALLEQALQTAKNSPATAAWAHRLEFELGPAEEKLDTKIKTTHIETFYIDPMFNEKKQGSALPPLRMQIFRDLFQGSEFKSLDSPHFIGWARTRAKKRVVVKRPLKMANSEIEPTHSYLGKSIRYDMYNALRYE